MASISWSLEYHLAFLTNVIPKDTCQANTYEYPQKDTVIKQPEKCQKWEWYSLYNLPGKMLDNTEGIIKNYKAGKVYQGLTTDIVVKGSDGNNCTLTFKDGLLTSETCP